jgi:phasin
MIGLLFRSFLWAATWPAATYLLMVAKAADRMQPEGNRPDGRTGDAGRGSVKAQERGGMANDAFKAEIPDAVRDMMRMSIEQAKRAFDTFAATSEKTWKTIESSSESARANLHNLNQKIGEITRKNAEANFALAMQLAESKDVNQAIELQGQHAREQMETFAKQLEEMRDLAARMIQEANAAGAGAAKSAAQDMASAASSAASAPGFTSSHYAPRDNE